MSTIDPIQWKEEVERVTPLLIEAKRNVKGLNTVGDDWLSRVNLIKESSESHFSKTFSSEPQATVSGKDNNNNMNNMDNKVKGLAMETAFDCENLAKELKQSIVSISKAESLLNSQMKLSQLSQEYAQYKKVLTDLEKESSEKSKFIENRSNELSEIEERLSELNEKLKAHMDGESGEAGNPVEPFRRALKQIKTEIQEINVRIGFLSTEIMIIKCANRNRMIKKKQLKRSGRNKYKNNDAEEEEEEL